MTEALYEHPQHPGRWRLLKTPKGGETIYENTRTGERRELPKAGLLLVGPDGKTLIRLG